MNGHLAAVIPTVLWLTILTGHAKAADSGEVGLQEERPSRTPSFVINIYDLGQTATLQSIVDALAPLVRQSDVFTLVSGNHRGTPDIAAISRSAEMLHARFPSNDVWVLTSGLSNVKMLAEARDRIPGCVSAIVYDYEPNWENEPEFNLDLKSTTANFAQAVKLANGARFALHGAPTGRPLIQPAFSQYEWDYGRLAQASGADGMLIQTQTYCKKGPEVFRAAMTKLKAQQLGAGRSLERVYPQITVDPNAPNGAPVAQAAACVRDAQRAGFSRFSLWFSPTHVEKAVQLLRLVGRD